MSGRDLTPRRERWLEMIAIFVGLCWLLLWAAFTRAEGGAGAATPGARAAARGARRA